MTKRSTDAVRDPTERYVRSESLFGRSYELAWLATNSLRRF